MAQSIKISDEEMELVRREAELSSRSIAGQVTHWMRIGRALERAPGFSYAHVRAALAADRSPDALSADEQEVYLDALADVGRDGAPEQDAFFKARRETGLGVGLEPADGATGQDAA